ncbi:MAG: ABC transporter substrate-binding protein [Chloroflexota bacterium]
MTVYQARVLKVACFAALLSLFLASCAPAATPAPTAKLAAPATAPNAAPKAPPTAPAAKETPKPAAPAPTTKPAGEQPRYGGELSLPNPSDPPNLDIHRNVTISLFSPAATVYNGLVAYDQSNKVVPDLAERWEVSPDGKVYTFHLRKGVKWHDGKPFSSADARFSLERIMGYATLKAFIEAVEKVEAPDENTLKVTLEYRQAGFLPLLGHGRSLIAPKHVIEEKKDLKRDAIGTGPFKLKEYLLGVSFRMEKNQDYYVKGRPYLDKITFYIIRDVATRFAGFRTGRLQIYGHPPTHGELLRTHVDLLKKEMPQAVVRPYDSMQAFGLMPNWNRAPWNDVRVRRAAFLAVDREKGLEVVSEGVGTIGITLFYDEWAIPKDELMKMPGFRQPKDQDIADAKKLLAEAGYPNGFKSTVLVRAAYALYDKAAIFMRDQLAKVGIDLALSIIDYAVWTDARSKLNFDTMLVVNPLPLTDPDGAGRYISRKLGGQFASSDDDKMLELYAKQSLAENDGERKKVLYELQLRIAEVVPHIMIAWQNSFIAFWPEVKGYTASSCIYSHNTLDDIWLTK